MTDISGFDSRITIRASNTFPSGFTVTQFADDADPFDLPSQQVADKAMGLNGHLVTWSKANPIMATLNVIPDTEDDRNLAALVEANRASFTIKSKKDEGTLVEVAFPQTRVLAE